MKLLKKLSVLTVATVMITGFGLTSVNADTTVTDSESTEVREVVFSEDFESFTDRTVPATVGGVSQTWDSITVNGTNITEAGIRQPDDNSTNKTLLIGNNGNNIFLPFKEYISFGQTFSEGKYEFSYNFRYYWNGAYSEYFMTLVDSDKNRATWEVLADNYFWTAHKGLTPNAPQIGENNNGISFIDLGLTNSDATSTPHGTKKYVNVKTVVDFDAKKYTITLSDYQGNEKYKQTYPLNTTSISGFYSTFERGIANASKPGGSYGGSDERGEYYIDNIKVTKIYDLIPDSSFSVKDGDILKVGCDVPTFTVPDGVTATVSYTKNDETFVPETDATLQKGNYTMTVKASDGTNERTKTVSFRVVADVTYTNESEIILFEDFTDKTVGDTVTSIGGVAQSGLSSNVTVADDNGNKVLSMEENNGTEFIAFGQDYSKGKFDVSYDYKVVTHSTVVTQFMRLADSSKNYASYELLTPGSLWYARTDSGYTGDGDIHGSSIARTEYYTYTWNINYNIFIPTNGPKTSPGRLGSTGKAMEGMVTSFNSGGRGDFKGSDSGTNKIYIDNIKVKKYYGLAVNLPYTTGETYKAGSKVEIPVPADDVEYTSVKWTKDGSEVALTKDSTLEVGKYTMTVSATDGYNEETRTVSFDVKDTFEVTKAYMKNSDGGIITELVNGEAVTAVVELNPTLTGNYEVIAVMRSSNKSITAVQSLSKNNIIDNKATFAFSVPKDGNYTLEYYVWETLGSLKPILSKGDFVSDAGVPD